ncbi:hypothetical protein BD779DRAFT_1230204 [Infundibulicybe gibba]|nr:hypothetical protein BD779DRAFT_1230204 [Infundibulicybe gibba]
MSRPVARTPQSAPCPRDTTPIAFMRVFLYDEKIVSELMQHWERDIMHHLQIWCTTSMNAQTRVEPCEPAGGVCCEGCGIRDEVDVTRSPVQVIRGKEPCRKAQYRADCGDLNANIGGGRIATGQPPAGQVSEILKYRRHSHNRANSNTAPMIIIIGMATSC